MNKLRIYLDTCCYNRPFDDLENNKIRIEVEAIQKIIELSNNDELIIVSSQFVEYEIKHIKLDEKRENVINFYCCDEFYGITSKIEKLARYYQTFNLKTFDSLHLATAEINNVDYLLTTDTDFIKFSKRFVHKTKVTNPYDFIKEEF